MKFASSAVVGCGFQSKGDPDSFILRALRRPKEDAFAPISAWRSVRVCSLTAALHGGAAQGTLN